MKLTLYTWDSVLDAEFEHGKFWLDPYIPVGGITFMHGPKSTGKTAIQLEWARAIALGESWLGLPTRKGRVLLVEVDQPIDSLQSRMKSMGAKGISAQFLAGVGNLNLPTPSVDVAAAFASVQKTLCPDVVFFNTLRKTTALNLNDGTTVQLVYAAAREMFPKASLVFVHHPHKSAPSNVHVNEDELHSGSHSWRDDAQVSLHLEKWKAKSGKKLKSSARLRMTGSQVSPLYKPLPLLLGPDGVTWTSPLVDELKGVLALRAMGLEGGALDREAVKRHIVGSISTARLRRAKIEAGFPGTREWLGLEHEDDEGGDDERDEGGPDGEPERGGSDGADREDA